MGFKENNIVIFLGIPLYLDTDAVLPKRLLTSANKNLILLILLFLSGLANLLSSSVVLACPKSLTKKSQMGENHPFWDLFC